MVPASRAPGALTMVAIALLLSSAFVLPVFSRQFPTERVLLEDANEEKNGVEKASQKTAEVLMRWFTMFKLSLSGYLECVQH